MLIVCPNCATSYPVKPSSLGAAGRSVRCVRCQTVWFAASAPEQADTSDTESSDWSLPLYGGGPFFEDDADLLEDRQEEPDRSDAPPEQLDPPSHAEPATAPVSAVEPKFIEPKLHASPVIQERVPIYSPKMAAPNPAASAIRNTRAASIADTLEDIETFAARQIKQRRRRAPVRRQWSVPILPMTILALLVANVVLIGWRSDVARLLPQTASLYRAIGLPINLRGLAFSTVTSTTETQDGVPVLVVEGTITAISKRVVEVPRLHISLRNPNGHEVHTWTAAPGRSVLSPGETIAFRSRLASPPADGQQVIVRFFNRRDMVAGLQ